MGRSRLALVVLALLVSGCAGAMEVDPRSTEGASDAPAIVPAEEVQPIEGDPLPPVAPHDHADPAQHDVQVNMELLAHPATDDSGGVNYLSGVPLGLNIRFGELDVQGDWLVQCSTQAEGAYLWNIADRAAPAVASRLATSGGCADIKLTRDARYAIIGGGDPKVYDLSDPSDPIEVLADEEAAILGCHMCSVTTIDGVDHVVSQGAPEGAGFRVVRLTRDPVTAELVGTWGKPVEESLLTLGEPDAGNTIHDQYVYHDRLLNKTLVVPAMWNYGIYVVDISDPTSPTELGHWGDYRGESGNIHTTAVDIRTIHGEERRIIVAATETGTLIGPLSATEPGYVYVFDATDLANIQLLGKWANPGMRPTGYDTTFFPVGEYSAHNLQFVDGRVYIAHYHAGVWVIDVDAFLETDPAPKGDARLPLPDAIPNLGVYVVRDAEVQAPGSVWDVVVKDGHVYASDYALGLFVLRYLGDPLHDPAITSTA